jgi:hypothetical protein
MLSRSSSTPKTFARLLDASPDTSSNIPLPNIFTTTNPGTDAYNRTQIPLSNLDAATTTLSSILEPAGSCMTPSSPAISVAGGSQGGMLIAMV